MWFWPAGSVLIIIASTGAGLSLANSVLHQG
jgi:hypothetical protein